MRSYPPLAVVAAQVLLGRGLQLQEVLLHRGPDGALDYPEKTHTPDGDRIHFFYKLSAAVFFVFFVLTSARQLSGHQVFFSTSHLGVEYLTSCVSPEDIERLRGLTFRPSPVARFTSPL